MKEKIRNFEPAFEICRATKDEITTRPAYLVSILAGMVLIMLSSTLAMFTFNKQIQAVREIGFSAVNFWMFLICLVYGALSFSRELEGRVSMMILTKPLSRFVLLAGKSLGIFLSLLPGVFLLLLALLWTLWDSFAMKEVENPYFAFLCIKGTLSVEDYLLDFLSFNCTLLLKGFILALGAGVLLSVCASCLASAFSPVVSAVGIALVYLVGNASSAISSSGQLGRIASILVPPLSNFNLQAHFSEGLPIGISYLTLNCIYAIIYSVMILLVTTYFFDKRDV